MRARTVVLSMILLAGGCSDRGAEKSATPPVASAAPAPVPTVAPPAPALPPAVVEPVETALTAVREFNAGTEAQLTAIGEAEAKYAPGARRALEAARRGDVAGAKKPLDEANAARKANGERRAAFDTASTDLTTKTTAATTACTTVPELAAYPGCVALVAEQTTLSTNLDLLARRFDAAEAAWSQLRPGLDEAAATVALGR